MGRFVYTATFEGSAAPANDDGSELKVQAQVVTLTPLAKSEPPAGLGTTAQFESVVIMSGAETFGESGAIDFGGGNVIRFSEISPGKIAPASDGRAAGAVGWKVDSGTGVLQGASGYITSNFSVGDSGDVVDHQLGAILLQ
jgi:hypothetical protein